MERERFYNGMLKYVYGELATIHCHTPRKAKHLVNLFYLWQAGRHIKMLFCWECKDSRVFVRRFPYHEPGNIVIDRYYDSLTYDNIDQLVNNPMFNFRTKLLKEYSSDRPRPIPWTGIQEDEYYGHKNDSCEHNSECLCKMTVSAFHKGWSCCICKLAEGKLEELIYE